MGSFESIVSQAAGREPIAEVPVETNAEVTEPVAEAVETTASEPEAPVTPTPEEEPNEERKGWVPYDALKEAREEKRVAKASLAERDTQLAVKESEIAELKRLLEERGEAKVETDNPDFFDSPDEAWKRLEALSEQKAEQLYARKEAERAHAAMLSNFEQSDTRARAKHGDEKVQAALDWAEARANESKAGLEWAQRGLADSDPVEWLLRERHRQDLIDGISSAESETDYILKRAAELGLNLASEGASNKQTAEKAKAPQSLASIGSGSASGSPVTLSGSATFAAIVNKLR